jgi:hypothetical protein
MASSGLRVPLETISSSVSVRHMPMVDLRYSSNVAMAVACTHNNGKLDSTRFSPESDPNQVTCTLLLGFGGTAARGEKGRAYLVGVLRASRGLGLVVAARRELAGEGERKKIRFRLCCLSSISLLYMGQIP